MFDQSVLVALRSDVKMKVSPDDSTRRTGTIAVAGRKNVIGKPMLYKTTKEFLLQFGLKDLTELPSLKEFEEIRRLALSDGPAPAEPEPVAETVPAAPEPEQEPGGSES